MAVIQQGQAESKGGVSESRRDLLIDEWQKMTKTIRAYMNMHYNSLLPRQLKAYMNMHYNTLLPRQLKVRERVIHGQPRHQRLFFIGFRRRGTCEERIPQLRPSGR